MSSEQGIPTALLPMLHVQMKEGESFDFMILHDYILNNFGEEPSKYLPAINSMTQLRNDAIGVSANATGRDVLYRYYGQLELMELHFQIADTGIKFKWLDSFNREPTVQSSPAFEKASIIFNIGALVSNMAASANRSEEVGIKTACNYFECAAGVFQYIADNFLHAPSIDMSKDMITVLVNVMLAQAQECFVDKVVMEKKKSGIISKLAAQASLLYQQALDSIQNVDTIKSYCPPLWVNTIKIKVRYFNTLAQYHRAIIAESEGKYGEWVGRMLFAESLAKEMLKLAKDLTGMAGLSQLIWSNTAKKESASGGLNDAVKNLHTFIALKAQQALKDNDLIYHESVPQPASLPSLDKLAMSQPKKLTDVFAHLPSVVGQDLFSDLVPIEVHEKSSVYSEEKSQLFRRERDRVADADGEAAARVASMTLPESLDHLKRIYKELKGISSVTELPREVQEWFNHVKQSESRERLSDKLQKIAKNRTACQQSLNEIDAILTQDSNQWADLNAQYGYLWSQTGPETAAQPFRSEIDQLKRSIEAGQSGDQKLMEKHAQFQGDIALLSSSENEINQLYKSTETNTGGGSLLDLPVETVNQKDSELLKKVDDLLQDLYQIKKDRQSLLNELKEKIQNEDINQLLVLNKRNEENVFKVELEKFNEYKHQISENIQKQSKLLEDLAQNHSSLLQSELAKTAQQRVQTQSKVTKRLHDARNAYEDVATNAQHGLKYYENLYKSCVELQRKCNDFLQKRQSERRDLISKMGQNQTELLQKKLSSLSVSSTPSQISQSSYAPSSQASYPPQGPPAYQHPPPLSQLPSTLAQPPLSFQQQPPQLHQPAYHPYPQQPHQPGYYGAQPMYMSPQPGATAPQPGAPYFQQYSLPYQPAPPQNKNNH